MRLSEEERAYFKACSDELLEHHLVQSMSRYETAWYYQSAGS